MARTTATVSFQAIELKGSLLPGSLQPQQLEDAYLGALEADRVRRGESSTRSLDAVLQDLGLDC